MALYERAVAQAREPAFYRDLGVPDSLDGRYEMIMLHACLLFMRLKRDGAKSADFSQELFDLIFLDMDRSLREMGVGDLGVGKRVKHMAQGLYGRLQAYEAGLAGGEEALAAALRRNLFGTVAPDERQVAAMAAYLRREAAALGREDLSALMAGEVIFGGPPEAVPEAALPGEQTARSEPEREPESR